MSPATQTLLAFNIIAIGFIGIILSFLVQDRKKANLSLALAGIIIVVGLFQCASQTIDRIRFNHRMSEFRNAPPVDIEALKQQMKEHATQPAQINQGNPKK